MTERTLADLLQRRRDSILDAWSTVIMDESLEHYRDRSPELVRSWVNRALEALVDGLTSGSRDPLDEYGRDLGEERQQLGFRIEEVLDALLCGKQALVPIVVEEMADQPQLAVTVLSAFASAVRTITCAFAAVFTRALSDQQQRVSTLEERQRVARDLHDSVTQSLYAANMYGGAVERLLVAGDVARASQHMTELRAATAQALREMRLLIFDLRTTDLLKGGLVDAIQGRLAAVEGRAGVATELVCQDPTIVPRAAEEGVFGIVREALNNSLKHAAATRVRVEIQVVDGRVCVSVADNGAGFDVDNGWRQGGLGLSGMRERAEAMGAELTVCSSPDKGTRVSVVLRAAECRGEASS